MARLTPKSRGVIDDDISVELPQRYHLEGCPEDPERLDWHTTVPTTGPYTGEKVAVIRCVQCGGERTVTLADLREEDSAEDSD